MLEEKNVGFLNSNEDFRAGENFTALLSAAALKAFRAQGISQPDEHFRGERIRVHGTISLYRKRPQIVVNDPRQITLAAGERRASRDE
jgi:DNA/RNA endonuclease YhcR with UshA esterase domain